MVEYLMAVLQTFIPVVQNVTAAVIPVAMVLAFLGKRQQENFKSWVWHGVICGLLSSFTIVILRLSSTFIKREVYECGVLSVALLAEILLLIFFWRARKKGYPDINITIPGKVIFTVAFTLFLYRGFEFFIFPANILIAANPLISLDVLFKMIGCLLGFGLALLTGIAVFRVARVLPVKSLLTVTTVGFIVIIAHQLVVVIQVLLGRGIIPMKKWLLGIMIPLINYQTWFLYALFAVTFALVAILYMGRKITRQDDLNPAQYRKVLITVRKQLNWGAVIAVNLLLVFILSTAGKAYADQKVEITPAVPVSAVQGAIAIPLEKVSDGRLHRFSFRASNGTTLRFIIIKKSGSAYGVGLDACDICGPTGYYEREDQVVCKLCDVVMNKATIGFKGGCNPVPLEYKMTAGKLVIPAAALEKEKGRFK
jgi:uncharacterized membrane protein